MGKFLCKFTCNDSNSSFWKSSNYQLLDPQDMFRFWHNLGARLAHPDVCWSFFKCKTWQAHTRLGEHQGRSIWNASLKSSQWYFECIDRENFKRIRCQKERSNEGGRIHVDRDWILETSSSSQKKSLRMFSWKVEKWVRIRKTKRWILLLLIFTSQRIFMVALWIKQFVLTIQSEAKIEAVPIDS